MIFQFSLIIFAIFAIIRTYKQYRLQRVSASWLTSWLLLWLAVILVAISPQSTDILAKYVGVERGADLLVYSAVVILYYGLYRMMVKQEKLQQELTSLVRKIAIMEEKKIEAKKDR